MPVPVTRPSLSIILPDLRGGGAERVMLDLAREFVREGYTVEFALMQATGEFLQEAQSKFSVVDMATPRFRTVMPSIARYLSWRRPETVLAAMWPLTAIAPVAARVIGFQGKVIVGEHAMLSLQYAAKGRLHRLGMRASTIVGYRLAVARVGVSHGTSADMAALSSMPVNKFTTIHNPIPAASLPLHHDLSAAHALWGTDGKRILTVGNLKAVKNHSLLLRAFKRSAIPGSRLMLLGRGENEVNLRGLAAELGISDQVIFAGFHSDPSAFYATADMFVLSSDHEGFGNVLVEALSFGLPIVSTDCPSGPAEILKGGQFGRLVPVGDVSALAQAIELALAAPVDRDALIRRAAEFEPEIAARKYLDLLALTCPPTLSHRRKPS